MADRESISIEAVHHGTLPIHIEGSGTISPTGSPSKGGVESAQTEKADYAAKGISDQRYSEMNVFRLDPGGKSALQVPVRLRVVPPDFIEITEGMQEGEQVIVSDMSPLVKCRSDTDRVMAWCCDLRAGAGCRRCLCFPKPLCLGNAVN